MGDTHKSSSGLGRMGTDKMMLSFDVERDGIRSDVIAVVFSAPAITGFACLSTTTVHSGKALVSWGSLKYRQ